MWSLVLGIPRVPSFDDIGTKAATFRFFVLYRYLAPLSYRPGISEPPSYTHRILYSCPKTDYGSLVFSVILLR